MSASRQKKVVAPLLPEVEDGADEAAYQYFALDGAKRAELLKQKIEDREKLLFDLATAIIQLEVIPEEERLEDHRTEDQRKLEADRRSFDAGTKSGVYPCGCMNCELRRLNRSYEQVRGGLKQLRSLYRDIA